MVALLVPLETGTAISTVPFDFIWTGANPTSSRRIEAQDGPTLQVLLADVMGQVCERLVTDPEADEIMAAADVRVLGSPSHGMVGRVIWPGKNAAFVRSILEQRPGRFRAAFLEVAELGEV